MLTGSGRSHRRDGNYRHDRSFLDAEPQFEARDLNDDNSRYTYASLLVSQVLDAQCQSPSFSVHDEAGSAMEVPNVDACATFNCSSSCLEVP